MGSIHNIADKRLEKWSKKRYKQYKKGELRRSRQREITEEQKEERLRNWIEKRKGRNLK